MTAAPVQPSDGCRLRRLVAVGVRTVVRHRTAPNPYGCRWCGDDQGHHGTQWVRSVGMHRWAQPTRAQILARMTACRNARKDCR